MAPAAPLNLCYTAPKRRRAVDKRANPNYQPRQPIGAIRFSFGDLMLDVVTIRVIFAPILWNSTVSALKWDEYGLIFL